MLTEKDIIIISDILSSIEDKYMTKDRYLPSALRDAIKHFNETYNKELSLWSEELEL